MMFTRGLAKFIERTNYTDLPPELVAAARRAILDHIGVSIAGSQAPLSQLIIELVRENKSSPDATVIASGFKASCSLAALANGTIAHALDYDDCLDFPHVGLAHPTTSILPAVLAVSEKLDISGRELITAYCVGVEAYSKTGLFAIEAFRGNKGWEWTGVLGAIGATAAVAKLLKLDEHKTAMALGTASSLASGLTRNFGTMTGPFHAGHAARNGVEAAFLANKGFTSHEGILEMFTGFYTVFTGIRSPAPEDTVNEQIKALGNPWNILSPGLMFKAFPCAHTSNYGAYAAVEIKKKHAFDWREISEVEFRLSSRMQPLSVGLPETGLEGKFSLGYCMVRGLIDGEVKITDFTDDKVKEPSVRQLMDKIKWVYLEPVPGERPFSAQEIVVKLYNGNTFSFQVEHSRGEPGNPLSDEEFAAKYYGCASHAGYDRAVASQIKDLILNLEKVENVSQLTRLIGKREKKN
jgi:2-methylcitrate dehydratase PrpD